MPAAWRAACGDGGVDVFLLLESTKRGRGGGLDVVDAADAILCRDAAAAAATVWRCDAASAGDAVLRPCLFVAGLCSVTPGTSRRQGALLLPAREALWAGWAAQVGLGGGGGASVPLLPP